MNKNNCLPFHVRSCICSLIFCCCLKIAAAQTTPDSIILQQAIAANRQLYVKEMGDNLRFYNGQQYINSTERARDFPFWLTDSSLTGTIVYDGNYYDNMPMKYDLVNQDIVINSYKDQVQVMLVPEKIQSFTLRQHNFIMIDAIKNNYSGISNGFYDQLATGTVQLWAKRTKKFELPVKADEQIGTFKETDLYYIQADSTFYPVTSKRDILRVLKNKSDNVNSFIKSNNLNLKKDFEASLIKIVNFYNQ